MRKADFIIVGQGIAGTVLAHELLATGASVIVIDDPALSACSKVSGGIYNPVVFKRLTKSWLADTILPVMHETYATLEAKLQTRLLYPIRLAHALANSDEEAHWKKKSLNELAEFIDGHIRLAKEEHLPGDGNVGYVKEAGYIAMQDLLSQSRAYFLKHHAYVNEKFDYAALKLESDGVTYRDIAADKVLFCEGYLYKNNPWFAHIPFKPAKGETLTVRCKDLTLCTIFTKDFFILPLPEAHTYKVGATYEWDKLNDDPSPEARQTLLDKFKKAVPLDFEVMKHEAGVRPATIDRRPVLGFHAEKPNLGIFNGFGTKGVMLVPFFAKHFCSFIQKKTALWQEVDIKRFSARNVS